MKLRTDKWHIHLVAFAALVVVATGLAATPLRQSLTPFVTKPLGSWSLPVPRSTGQATTPVAYSAKGTTTTAASGAAAAASGVTAELAGTVGTTPAQPDSTIARNVAGLPGLIDQSDVTEHGGSSASSGANSWRQGGNWNLGGSGSGRSFRFVRPGGFGGGAGRSAFSGSGSIGRGNPNRGSNGSGAAGSGGSNGPGPIFNDHKSGFPELTGRRNGAFGGGGGAGVGNGPKLASNPEPSTLLLFGTGLMTAVGTIRRRLRRQ